MAVKKPIRADFPALPELGRLESDGLSADEADMLARMPEADELDAIRWCKGCFSRRSSLKVGDYPSRTHWEVMQYASSDPKWLFDPRWTLKAEKPAEEEQALEIDETAVLEFERAVAAGKARMA